MELYFVRHAIAADRPPDGSDNALRALTREGAERMRVKARALRVLGVAPDLLFTSPYTRAWQTADIIAEELKLERRVVDMLAPGFNLNMLQQILAPYAEAQRIILVGHDPDFSTVIGMLTGGRIELKKGGVCRVDCDVAQEHRGVLVWLLAPRVLRALGGKESGS